MFRPTTPLLLAASFIRPLSPTGPAGPPAHPAPRPALIAIYNTTLALLGCLPAHSAYRGATANMTQHRLARGKAASGHCHRAAPGKVP